ncbi:MAG TPA: hypothetical protein VNW97_22055 [Candidatus Saccharimonadales bacterium]|nr:hypothetical protein [Candidatus Saccharimonadales bacterium]
MKVALSPTVLCLHIPIMAFVVVLIAYAACKPPTNAPEKKTAPSAMTTPADRTPAK